MECAEAGRRGGSSRSEKKRASSARNLETARLLRHMIPKVKEEIKKLAENGDTDKIAEQWLVDAEKSLERLENPVVLVAGVRK